MFEWKFWSDPASVALMLIFTVLVTSLFVHHRSPAHHPGEMYWRWMAYGLDPINVAFHNDQLYTIETYWRHRLVHGLDSIHSGRQNYHEPHSSCPSSTGTSCATSHQLHKRDYAKTSWRPLVQGLDSIHSGLQDYHELHNSCPFSTGTSCATNDQLHKRDHGETFWRALVHGLDSKHSGLQDHHEPRSSCPPLASSSGAAPDNMSSSTPFASKQVSDNNEARRKGDPDVDARADAFIKMMHEHFKCERNY